MSLTKLWEFFNHLLGLDASLQSLTILQVAIRAVLTYLAGYVLLRFGEHRFIGKNTAFDVVLGFIFGATLSRAINGAAPFFDTIAAGFVLLGLHWLFTTIGFHSDRLDVAMNGKAVKVIEEGEVRWDRLREQRINRRLLFENLRLKSHCEDPAAVKAAYYERNGDISVIPKQRAPRVVDVAVAEGVQTVRIQLE